VPGALYLDGRIYPRPRGHAYVAVSRFRGVLGVFHYGRLRRSDWLPTKEHPDEQAQPSDLSPRDWDDDSFDSESERCDFGAHYRAYMGADGSSESEGGGDLGAHYRSSMGVMGASSSGSEGCSDGSGDREAAWDGADGRFGAGSGMEGSSSDSAAGDAEVPAGGLRCGELEPLCVLSSDEVPSADERPFEQELDEMPAADERVAVKQELEEMPAPDAVEPPPAQWPRLTVS